VPTTPVVFMKPATALLKDDKPFYHPDFSKDIHYETEIVLKIGKNGKYINEKFAISYISEITVGIDFTARDLQEQQKQKGLPWEIAKAFDSSAVIGKFKAVSDFSDLQQIAFSMKRNQEIIQQGNTKDVIFNFASIISYVSQFFTLQQGDLIYTGTPAGVGKISIGETYEGYINEELLLSCEIK
jgi:2-keto-4-pentenoate hydratase/2-oxohepta-3-ene-1,7-dioic acid hydratase in catechol pathway